MVVNTVEVTLPIGQSVTSGAQDVIVYSLVEVIVDVLIAGTAEADVTNSSVDSVGQIVIVTAFFLVTVVIPSGFLTATFLAGAAISQVIRSNATVPLMLTK